MIHSDDLPTMAAMQILAVVGDALPLHRYTQATERFRDIISALLAVHSESLGKKP